MTREPIDQGVILMSFGLTDLRIGVSGAKFDAESAFEVNLAVAPQKPDQNCEQLIFCSKTLNGRLPPEDSSDWPETWPKRVSDDPRHFIFRRQKKNRRTFWIENSVFHNFGQVFEELQPNGPQNLLPCQILLQIHLS